MIDNENQQEKDKIGERMVALKQLVSPFGKVHMFNILVYYIIPFY